MQLSSTDIDLLQQIQTLDTVTLQKKSDGSGVPYLTSIFRLHKLLFNEVCTNCPYQIPTYIRRIKNYKNSKTMSKETKTSSDFALGEGVMIPILGTSRAISNANLTDEKALSILAANPNRKALFTKVPKDLDKRLAEYAKNIEVVGAKGPFDIAKNVEALKAAGVETKATTEKGVNKVISEPTKDQKSKFDEAMKGTEDAVPSGGEKNLEELQFDFDKAQQDFDSLDENASDADRATAQEAVTRAQDALNAAQPK